MGSFQTKYTCDGSVGINIARKSLRSERTALEEEKLNMEKEKEAEVAILGEKTKMHTEQCRESEKSEQRMVKEREEVEREKKTAINIKEMQKEKNKALLKRERSLHN